MMDHSPRNYLCQLADKSAFYISPKEGMRAMQDYSNGHPIFVRGRMIASHLVSQIRPCNFEENEASEEVFRHEKRKLEYNEGKKKIEEYTDEKGNLRFREIYSNSQLKNANNS